VHFSGLQESPIFVHGTLFTSQLGLLFPFLLGMTVLAWLGSSDSRRQARGLAPQPSLVLTTACVYARFVSTGVTNGDIGLHAKWAATSPVCKMSVFTVSVTIYSSRTDSTYSPDCLPILQSMSVFLLFTFSFFLRFSFYRAMQCSRGTSHGPVSVCLSVCVCLCLSVTSRSSTKTAKRRITKTTPHDSPGTLTPKISAKFDRGHPLRGRRMQVGWVKISDF